MRFLSFEIVKSYKEQVCPHCCGTKVVRNGVKRNGQQNYLCKGCSKQFQADYVYKGCELKNRQLVLRMLLRGSGVRDCSAVTGVSCSAILKQLKKVAAGVPIKPRKWQYRTVQIDEQWSYVAKKAKKVWMIYAYAVEENEIIAFTMGKRSEAAVRNLWVKLKALDIEWFLTDAWEAFAAVLPKAKHLVGKAYTKNIEGLNTFFRTRVRRLVRKTVCFSKKLIYHYSMIKLIIYHRNQHASYI